MSVEGTKMPEPVAWRYLSDLPRCVYYIAGTPADNAEFLYTATQVQALLLASREEAMALLLEARHQLPIAASCWNEDEDRDLAARNVEHVLGLIKRIDALSKGNQ